MQIGWRNRQFWDFKMIKIAGGYARIRKCYFIARLSAFGQHIQLVVAVEVNFVCLPAQLFAHISAMYIAAHLADFSFWAY